MNPEMKKNCFLRATVRAARWLDDNREAGATILHRVTYHPSVADTATAIAATDFLPTLTPQKLAGIDHQKKFLLDHGYIKRDFDSRDWAEIASAARCCARVACAWASFWRKMRSSSRTSTSPAATCSKSCTGTSAT